MKPIDHRRHATEALARLDDPAGGNGAVMSSPEHTMETVLRTHGALILRDVAARLYAEANGGALNAAWVQGWLEKQAMEMEAGR